MYLQRIPSPGRRRGGKETCADARHVCYMEHTLLGGSDEHYNMYCHISRWRHHRCGLVSGSLRTTAA
ncbi:hypothetical protein BQ8420_29040 [Nocardiopsis sp. JB363]|nr:hypothetical protein BQ8420_29040 [Nocardiopsis sp. JB363]